MDIITCCVAAVGLHLGTAHINPYPNAPALRDSNPGAYVEFHNGVVLGGYRNSLDKQSLYTAYNWQFRPVSGVVPSVVIGVATGYPAGRVVPLVMPSLRVEVAPQAWVRVSYAPKMRATLAHVVHFSMEYRF